MMQTKDYYYAAIAGFFTGIFAIPTLWNIDIGVPRSALFVLPVVIAPLWALGVWIGGILARFAAFMAQFARFVAVGFLNTAIDFGILNVLNMLTGVSSGFWVAVLNVPGFLIAVVNSYLWNKLWVFQDRHEGESLFHDFPKFFAVIVSGLIINGGIVYGMTTLVGPMFDLSPERWLNISKVLATAISLVWNFAGLKFLVFHPEDIARPRGAAGASQ